MSLETVILLIIFVLAPLLQQLLRGRTPEGRQPAPPPMPLPQGPPAPAPHQVEPPAPPRRPVPERVEGARPARRPPAAAPATPPRPLRERAPWPPFGGPRDLRRAVVLTTILGPCRANAPYDSP